MNIKNRTYFTNWPQTSANPGFAKHNHPTAEMFASLFDSITFKLNWEDKATLTQQGLGMVAADASAQTFVSKVATATGVDFVRPHQLPEIGLDSSALVDDTYVTQYGISVKRTKPSRTGGNGMKYSFKTELGSGGALEFKTNAIQLKGDDAVPGSGIYYFGVQNGVRGFYLNSALAAAGYWELTAETLHPASYQYNVDVGMYYFMGARLELSDTIYPAIYPKPRSSAGAGRNIYISAGQGYQVGDNGGTMYLFGGAAQGGGTNGGVVLCHTGTAGVLGIAAVGGAVETGYMLKVHGNMKVTGTLTIGNAGGGSPDSFIAVDAAGEVLKRATADIRNDIFPTGASAKIIVHSGTGWEAVSMSGNITIAANGATTIGTGVITNTMVAANADLGLSKIKGSTGDRVLVTNSVSKLLEESTATISDVQLLSGAAAAGVVANDILAIKGAYGVMSFGANGVVFAKGIQENQVVVPATDAAYNVTSTDRVIIVKIAAAGTTLNLPDISSKTDQVLKVIVQIQQGTAQDLIFDAAGTDAISYGGVEAGTVTITDPVAGTIFELYAAENGVWTLVKA